jgi:signal transduction histidine kinase
VTCFYFVHKTMIYHGYNVAGALSMLNDLSPQSSESAPDPNEVQGLLKTLSPVAAEFIRTIDASACYFYLAGPGQSFSPFFTEGSAQTEQDLFFSRILSPQTDAMLHRMVASPTTLLFGQTSETRHTEGSILEELHSGSAVVAPVQGTRELIALLIVTRDGQPRSFSAAEIRQVEWLAAVISPAVENTMRYHQTRERLAEAEALHQITLSTMQKSDLDDVLKIICKESQQMTSACGASIALIENSTWIRVVCCTGETPDTLGRMRANRSHLGRAIYQRTEPLIINHSQERPDSFSRLAIPLLVKGSTTGLLTLFKKTDFIADDARLMRIFAGQAAIAIDHVQLTSFMQEMTILEERHRLSRELHDSVNQLLYGISLYTEAALRQMDQGNLEASRRYIKNIEESDHAALKEMRMLIFGLRPSSLSKMGLQATLSQRMKSVEEKLGLQTSLKWRVQSVLEPQVEEVLYGVAQEALNNIIRHAKAHNVSIRLAENERHLTMTVKDDGTGFDAEQSSGGMGLKTMRERAASLNARLKIDSQPDQGTRIIVEVDL